MNTEKDNKQGAQGKLTTAHGSPALYATPTMKIGQHYWRLVVYAKPDGGRVTSYEWQGPNWYGFVEYEPQGFWSPQQDWPRYNFNDGTYGGLPKTLRKLYRTYFGEIQAALTSAAE